MDVVREEDPLKPNSQAVVECVVGRALQLPVPDGVLKVYMTPRDAGRLGGGPSGYVGITSGRLTGLAILITDDEDSTDPGEPMSRMDSLLRQSLHAGIGSKAFLTALPEPSTVSTVTLSKPRDILDADDLLTTVREQLAQNGAPVFVGALIWVRLSAGASLVLRVTDVDGVPGALGKVSHQTNVILADTEEGAPQEIEVGLESVGGLDDLIRDMLELVEIPLTRPWLFRQLGIAPPRGIILHGPPGAGKTHLTRALAHELGISLYLLNAPDLVGQSYGETEGTMRRLFSEAAHHAPSIICIDEVDIITGRRSELGSQSDVRMVSQLLTLMDGLKRVDGVMLVGTTNRLDVIDPAFRRAGRFDREIFIGPPNKSGRLEILKIHTRDVPMELDAHVFLDELASKTSGYVGADLMELVREAVYVHLRKTAHVDGPRQSMARMELTRDDFEAARLRVRPSAARHSLVRTASASSNELIGVDDQLAVVEALGRAVVGSELPRAVAALGGALITGPGGTGKSAIAYAVARSLDLPVVLLSGGDIFSRWLGETEAAVRQVFDRARRIAPSMVLLEALESLVPRRESDLDNTVVSRLAAQLYAELDAQPSLDRVLVIGTSSNPTAIDEGMLRPGRLGLKVEVVYPRSDVRRQMIMEFGLEYGISMRDDSVEWLVSSTKNMSGGAIRGILAALVVVTAGDRHNSDLWTQRELARALAVIANPTAADRLSSADPD